MAVFGKTSFVAEWVAPIVLKLPKRSSAATSGQRSAAQNGQ